MAISTQIITKQSVTGEMPVFELTRTAKEVLKRRYLLKDDQTGEIIESPEEMFYRVARALALADKNYGASEAAIVETAEKFHRVMTNFEFLSGMALMNAGRQIQQLSACYVLPLEDSMDSIYTTLKNAAFLHKTGAGIGYDFSKLRPRNATVKTTGGTSSGPVSFMKLIDFSCQTIVHNAARRRAGNMGILKVDHPDIKEFITAKVDNTQLINFNISVALTDKFMAALKAGENYELYNPQDGSVTETLSAKEIYQMIVERAWRSAEPGVVFIDKMEADNPTPHVGEIRATNQCGEQPLLPYEACNLGSIVLSKFVKRGTGGPVIEWERLAEVVKIGVHFLDNTVDINHYPLPEIKQINRGNRRIGLGVMGWADMLVAMEIPYDSDEAVNLGEQVMKFINDIGHEASRELAKKRGSFPNFVGSKWEKRGYTEMRNTTVTTVAPTGTTSIFADCSSGIEPIFALGYVRKNILNQDSEDEFSEVHAAFAKTAKENWFYSQEVIDQVAATGRASEITAIPEKWRRIFVTSHELDWRWHVKHQAAFQRYTDNAVSKTINLPESATVQDIAEAYELAYDLGCKGVTIYRDKSRDKQVLNVQH